MGLHVHLDRVFRDNFMRQGPDIQRKNNFIINTGDIMTMSERQYKIDQNKGKYGLTAAEINSLNLPK